MNKIYSLIVILIILLFGFSISFGEDVGGMDAGEASDNQAAENEAQSDSSDFGDNDGDGDLPNSNSKVNNEEIEVEFFSSITNIVGSVVGFSVDFLAGPVSIISSVVGFTTDKTIGERIGDTIFGGENTYSSTMNSVKDILGISEINQDIKGLVSSVGKSISNSFNAKEDATSSLTGDEVINIDKLYSSNPNSDDYVCNSIDGICL